MSGSEDEFIDVKRQRETHDYQNNLAWGNKRGNFYQKDEEEYSEIQEEEDEVQNIMERIAGEVDEEDFILNNKPGLGRAREDQVEEERNDYSENIKMLKVEILSALKRVQEIQGEGSQDSYERFEVGKLGFRQEYINSHQAYVMTMLMLIKMYQNNETILDKHSIIARLGELKSLCDRFQEQKSAIQYSGEYHTTTTEEKKSSHIVRPKSSTKNSKRQDDENLEKYNDLVKRHKKIKKQQKRERRAEKISVIPSKPFQQVGQNEARSINYTISKNKGLTRRRGKKPRSSRASNREKFNKKMIKYRSAHPMYKDHGLDYTGEQDIKIGKIQSSKLV